MCREEMYNVLQQEKLAGASLLIFANKQDIVNNKETSCNDISNALELNDDNIRHDQRHWKIQGCSAKTGTGLIDGIDWLVDDISNRIYFLS